MSLNIRRVRPGEAGLVLAFIRELAEYEKLSHEVEATEAMTSASDLPGCSASSERRYSSAS